MPNQAFDVEYLDGSDRDADSIAALHADSWRRHYRGAYLDTYLDGDVVADRREVWRSRLTQPRESQLTVSDLKRTSIGSRLLSETARRLLRLRPEGSLHLWVLDQNTAAQAFYAARGGSRVETQLRGPFPGGGRALGHRYNWTDPTGLLSIPGITGDDELS